MIGRNQGRATVVNLRRMFLALLALASAPAFAQDAKSVIAETSKAMGLDGVTSLYYYGAGAQYSLGQNNNANGPWPKTPLNEYTRAINFQGPATRATWTTFAAPVTGGPPAVANGQQNVTATTTAWAQQLEIWITPWGFVKGAEANGATLATRTVNGKRYQVLTWNSPAKSPGGKNYQLTGYINADKLVEKVETLLDHPVFGDMLVEAEYTFYRDNNGFKFPSEIVQKRAGWPVFDLQILGAWPNPSKIATLLGAAAPAGGPGGPGGPPPGGAGGPRAGGPPPGAGGPPAGGAPPAAAAAAASTKLADGVYQIRGAYNSLAVEFADHVVLFEPGPQNEARALQGVAETKRLFPNKPIRYGVPTHHHIDHTGGIAGAASDGMTIVVPEVSKAFFEKVLGAPRTLAPDSLSKSGVKPKVEGFKGDKRVFADATRTLEIHVIKSLPHADGIVVAWLPKEKILVYADMFNFPPAATPVPDPPVVGSMVFLRNIEQLGFDQPGTQILSVHTMNPDKLVTVQEIRASLGSNKL
jgi:glyoxylase-like metal-dependent hydrolase (beta-lactamase superfamily II)